MEGGFNNLSLTLLPGASEHPISGAIRGLPILLPWPIALDRSSGEHEIVVLAAIPGDAATWSETQWLRLWQAQGVPEQERHLIPEQPQFTEGVDQRDGPWTVAAAVERRSAETGGRQRLVAVGSNIWYTDRVAFNLVAGEAGRAVTAWPGNLELFESSVYWLAGQERLIAQSVTARATPRVREMSKGELGVLRWGVVAGLPLAVLVVGGLLRLVRR